jgi:hypothetical protein
MRYTMIDHGSQPAAEFTERKLSKNLLTKPMLPTPSAVVIDAGAEAMPNLFIRLCMQRTASTADSGMRAASKATGSSRSRRHQVTTSEKSGRLPAKRTGHRGFIPTFHVEAETRSRNP